MTQPSPQRSERLSAPHPLIPAGMTAIAMDPTPAQFLPNVAAQVPRNKPRHLGLSISYRLVRVLRMFISSQRLLRWSLDLAWISRRFAHELGTEIFGRLDSGIDADFCRTHIPPGSTVLDVGTGHGNIARLIAPYARRVVGIDHQATNLAVAKARTRESNIEFVLGYAPDDLSSEVFDIVILSHVLEHLDEPVTLLSGLRRNGRKLIVEVPDFGADKANALRVVLGAPYYSDNDHVTEFTENHLIHSLLQAGWVTTEVIKQNGILLLVATPAPEEMRNV